MSVFSRLPLAVVTAVGAVLLVPTAASADEPDLPAGPLSECVADLTAADLGGCLPPAPQEESTPPAGGGTTETQRTANTLGVPLGSGQDTEQTPVEQQDVPALQEADAPDPAALCADLREGLANLPIGIGPLAGLVDQLCAAAEADPLAGLQELLEGLLAQLPSLTDPAAGCGALIDAIEQGGAALGVDPTPLTGLIEQLCSFIPGEAPAVPTETPKPQPQPQPAAQPAVQYANCDDARAKGAAPVYAGQPGYRPALDSDNDGIGCEVDTAAAPVAYTTPTGTGRLAYTGAEPKPYLAAGAAALGLGGLLQFAGRRRRVDADG